MRPCRFTRNSVPSVGGRSLSTCGTKAENDS